MMNKLAKKVAKQLIATKRHDVVSCYTRTYEKGVKFASKLPNCKAYKNVEDAINDPNVDGVYIVTPHNAHFRYGKISLMAKKPTFIEKPFAVFEKEAEELVKLSKENNTYLAEAMWTWYGSTANNMKDFIDKKILVIIPHQDDEIHLAGGIIGSLKDTSNVYVFGEAANPSSS